jgi:hypothetical protein
VNEEPAPVTPLAESARLHQPWRGLVAGAEVVAATLAVWGAFALWGPGVRTLTMTLSDHVVLVSTRYVGSWMAAAIALGAIAVLLLVDAVREVLLAVRVGRREGGSPGSAGSIEGSLPDLTVT